MAAVVWYAYGGTLSDEEIEEEVQRRVDERERTGGKWGKAKNLIGMGKKN